jgi:hypothetical protein
MLLGTFPTFSTVYANNFATSFQDRKENCNSVFLFYRFLLHSPRVFSAKRYRLSSQDITASELYTPASTGQVISAGGKSILEVILITDQPCTLSFTRM